MPNPLKDGTIPTTHEVAKLGLTVLAKEGWITSWWAETEDDNTIRYYIQTKNSVHPTTVTTPEHVAIWIDGFLVGQGGL